VAFSPDGNFIYYIRSDKTTENYSYLYQMPVLGGNPRQLIRDIDAPVGFSPDGSQIVFMRGLPDAAAIEVRIASADGGGERLLARLPIHAIYMYGASWSPDAKAVALSGLQSGKEQNFVLDIIRVSDGSVATLYSSPTFLGRPVWLPDGDSLLVAIGLPKENRTQLWQIPYPKGEPLRFTNDLSDYGPFLDLTRDGKVLAAINETQISNIWLAPEGKAALARQITSGGVADIAVAPGPSGKLLVRQGSELDLVSADGSQRAVVMPGVRTYSTTSNCGDRYIIFDSYTGTKTELWRTDADGSNPTRLVQQDVGMRIVLPMESGWFIRQILPREERFIGCPSTEALQRKSRASRGAAEMHAYRPTANLSRIPCRKAVRSPKRNTP
jgi:Tol biopolymer transport system component